MVLYHFNIGYPFLDENTIMRANIASTEVREPFYDADDYNKFCPPKDKCRPEVYFHTIRGKEARIEIENPALKTKLAFKYNTANLPYFIQWKNMQSGNYVLGIEPASTHFNKKAPVVLKPSESAAYKFEILFSL